MTVLISEVIEEVRANIASFADVNVTLGAPITSEPGLCVFAYMFSEDPTFRRASANSIEDITDESYNISCLLMSSSPNDYVALDKGLRYLMENRFLSSDERIIRIEIPALSIDDLTQVFKSAGITLRLAVPFVLRCARS